MTHAQYPRPSRIGFGCASLGSRVSAKAGLAALNQAFDHGINWFDLAPSYGDGLAEEIFNHFSRGRRSEIYIVTKVGISPPRVNFFASALRPLAREILSYAPSLRDTVSKGRPRATRLVLTLESISESIERSLKRLGTDYIDVLALHDPEPCELESGDLHSALGSIVASGRVRAVGIAGSLDATISALRLGLPISHVQVANNPLQPQIDQLALAIEATGRKCYIVTHSSFGQKDSIRHIARLVESHPDLKTLLLRQYNLPLPHSIQAALVDYSLLTNHSGTVLFSMFSRKHLEFNLGRLNSRPIFDIGPLLEILRERSATSRDSDEQ